MTTDVNRRVLPGFSLSLGYTLLYISLLVAIPLAAGFLKASHLSFSEFWAAIASERALAAYRLTVGASLASAVINVGIGVLVAWVLVRYEFPLKGLLDSLVDLPFVLRTLQPVLEGLDRDVEEAAACLGANRLQTVLRVIFPSILPAVVTGFALAFARSLGEYGSVVFISGNMPFRTEIAPVLIVARLEEFAYTEATAIAVVLLTISFVTLFAINLLERWSKRHHG